MVFKIQFLLPKEHTASPCYEAASFEIVTAETMKSNVSWDLTPFSPIEFYPRVA
jgi:hypothetical protein